MISLFGMLDLSTLYYPINQNWKKYLQNFEASHIESTFIFNKLLQTQANEACEFIDFKEQVLLLFFLTF